MASDVATLARHLALAVALACCVATPPPASAAELVSHQGVEVVLHVGADWSAPIGARGDLEVDIDDALASAVSAATHVPAPAPAPAPAARDRARTPVWLHVAEVVVKSREHAVVVLNVLRETSEVTINDQRLDLLPPGAKVRFELLR